MFETTLTASNPQREGTHSLSALPAAIAVHALVLGLVVVGQLWAVDPVHDVVFVPPLVVHLPPPLAGRDGTPARRSVQRAGQTRVPREQVVQPVAVPEDVPRATDPKPSPDVPRVPGTEDPGEGPGTDPGIGNKPGQPGMNTGSAADLPRRIGGDVKAPVAISRLAPQYPDVARKMRIEGIVLVEAVIDEAGNVVEARVLKDIGMGCGQAAVETIRTWRYEPATVNGRPVSVYLEVRVSFRLHGAE